MNGITNSSLNWKSTLNLLLKRLSQEDKYRCIGGIPGPVLELRSGTLPQDIAHGNKISDVTSLLADITGLELGKLRKYQKAIAREYSFIKILRKYNPIILNTLTRLVLFEDYIKAIIHRLRGLSVDNNTSNSTREIQLHIRNQDIKIAYPANLVSLGLLWELFAEEAYNINDSVECIYDFGANIGLSAIYFHLINPSATIICIEPMEENIRLLKRNVHSNNIPANIMQVAVGKKVGKVTIFYSDQSHALPSLHTKQLQSRQVPMLPFDKIVSGKGYGLKIDIEGAEESLAKYPSIIENARWIVGEVHYSGNAKQDVLIDTFFNTVKSNFVVKKGRPIIYFVGNQVLLCESFRTIRKR